MTRQTPFVLGPLCAALVAGCQAPPSPAVRAFGDNRFWITVEDMVYVIGSTQDRIVVPKGFVTDFASIPQGLWSLGLGPQGRYSRAAVVHDYLYWSQGCTRAQADRLMVIAMKESRVGKFDVARQRAISRGRAPAHRAQHGVARAIAAGAVRLSVETF
jgi:hypothetical protein